jgi:hypothetical protein
LLYHRQIRCTVARRISGTGGGDNGHNHHDLGHNLHRALDLHLEFGRYLDLVLDLNNGSKLLFLLFSSSFCDNTSLFTICYDMLIRSSRVFIRIGF